MENTNKEIKFYGRKKEYKEFSNFFPFEIEIDGVKYKTTEHFFQAQKFSNTDIKQMKKVIDAVTPNKAATFGNDRSKPLRKDWELVKDDIMFIAIQAKFTQSQELGALLVSTGNAKLIEDAPRDYYWGCGQDGSGKNMLGELLMKLRDQLK